MSRGLGDVYKRQVWGFAELILAERYTQADAVIGIRGHGNMAPDAFFDAALRASGTGVYLVCTIIRPYILFDSSMLYF